MSKRSKANSRQALGIEKFFDRTYAHAGGYAKWVQTMEARLSVHDQSLIFGVTEMTIYNHRKWYEESKKSVQE